MKWYQIKPIQKVFGAHHKDHSRYAVVLFMASMMALGMSAGSMKLDSSLIRFDAYKVFFILNKFS